MRTVLACVGLVIVLCQSGKAQCPKPSQLTDTYRAVLLRPFDEQLEPLLALRKQWEQCRQPFDSIYVGTLLELGQGYHSLGDLNRAVGVVSRAVSVCRANSTRTRVADLTKAWYRLGVLRMYQNQIQASISALKQAVRTGSTDPQAANWVGNAYLYQAYNYTTLSDCQQTILQADAGLPFARQVMNKGLIANLLRQKAQALFILDDYAQAQPTILAAIDTILDVDTYQKALADSYNLLSLILAGQGQYQEAIRYAERSYAIAEKTKHTELPNFAIALSFLYAKVGNYAKATQYGQYGINHAVDAFDKAGSYSILGAAYWRQRQFDKALTYYQQGLRTLPIGFRTQATAANPDEDQLRLVAHKGISLTLLQDKADTWLDYAKATGSRQRLQYALATYRVADQMIDYMRWEHTQDESKLFWRQKTRGMYERAIETCWRLKDTDAAFRFFEKSRAVMLADNLNELGARQKLTPQQTAVAQQLQKAVNEQQALVANELPGKRYDSLRAVLRDVHEKQDAFRVQIERSNPAYFQYKYDTITTRATDLKAYLADRNAQFVSYFVGDSALYILSVSARRDTLIRQSLGAYKQTVRSYMTLLANPDAMNQTAGMRQFLTLGNGLYRQLLAPLRLPAGRVIVSPDGPFVPFEALSRSAKQADYAVTAQAFSYAYSAGLLLKKSPDVSATTQFGQSSFLGVAPVQFASVLKQVSLPGSDDALRTIASRFNAPVLLMRKQASRSDFLAHTNRAQVVHLFTHATASDSAGMEPRLYFADSVLNLSDLNESLLQTELVVLAACKTGVGTNERGEGVFSLARGFAALGVPSVVTTLWNVENRATYAITTDFYRYLADGLPKDEALQRAKLDWLTSADGASQLPNYWAGLIVVGNTEPLSHAMSWPWLAGGLGAVIVGVGGMWWWRKSRRAIPVTSWLRPARIPLSGT